MWTWFGTFEKEAGCFSQRGIREYLTEVNISRGWMAAAGLLLLQLANLANPIFYQYPQLQAGFAAVVPACVLFLLYYYIYQKKKAICSWRAKWLYLCFWGIVSLGMTPYFVYDAQAGGMPANCILLCGALMIVPVFPRRATIVLFAGYTALNLLISVSVQTTLVYHLYILLICGVGCFFSCRTHQFYMEVIKDLRESSRTDCMTQLFNRRGGREQLQSLLGLCLRHEKTFAFFMIDIDGFKQYNDKFGHQKGDAALTATAKCLKSCFERKTDVICRYGGEEFLVAASIKTKEEARRIAEKMRDSVEAQRIEGASPEVSPFLTISVGGAVYQPIKNRKQDITVEYMIKAADMALYAAKDAGRNCIEFIDVREPEELVEAVSL